MSVKGITLPVLPALLASFLLLFHLGNQFLWQDEAQTALIGRTILTEGVPRGFDGTNYFSQDLGAEYGHDHLWKWHPWLPFYVLAGFLKAFGAATFIARLPFALFGIATVVLAFHLGTALFRNRYAGFWSATLLSLSVPFLLLARQCRYFAPAMFLCTAVLFFHLRAMHAGRRGYYVMYAISLFLLCQTHQLFFHVIFVVSLTHAAIFYRIRFRRLAIAASTALLLSLPWLLWVYNVNYAGTQTETYTLAHFRIFFGGYASLIGRHLIGPILAGGSVLAATLCFARIGIEGPAARNIVRDLTLLGLLIVGCVLAVSTVSYGLFFRNLAPLVPAFAVIAGGVFASLSDRSRLLAAIALGISIAVSPLPQYLYEITHDYDGPVEGIVRYLNAYASRNDIVAVTYEDLPIKWYTGLRVVGGLTGEDLTPARDARWIILRKYSISKKDLEVAEYLAQNVDASRYDRIVLDYPDLPFENREEPDLHHYRTVTNEDRVVIYRRVR